MQPLEAVPRAPQPESRTPPLSACSLPPTALTVAQAVDLALCRNPATRSAWAFARAQAASLGEAESAWLPQVNVSAADNHTQGSSTGLIASASQQEGRNAVAIFVVGTALMRSAGCVMNDFADRNFDRHVERTRERPLAAGRVSAREALILAGILALLAFLLVLQLNRLTVKLSFVALALAVIYPFLKRVFWLPQAWLGVAFGFGIPMAFAAHQNTVVPLAWVLLLANIFWAIAYDTEYAMVDRDDDLKIGIRTSAITFGRFDVTAIMALYMAYLVIWACVGFGQGLGPGLAAGLLAAAGQR